MSQPKKQPNNASPKSGLVISWSIFLLLTITLFFISENLWKKKITLPPQEPQIFTIETQETQSLNLKLRFGGITSLPADASAKQVKIYATSLDGGPDWGAAGDKKTVEMTPDDNGVYQGIIELASNYFGHHYRLRVKGPKHLQSVFAEVVFSQGTVLDLTAKPLRPGDLDQDGKVDHSDLEIVDARMYSTSPGDLAVADVNFDKVVGITDRTLVLDTLAVQYDPE